MNEKLMIEKLILFSIEDEITILNNPNNLINLVNQMSKDEWNLFVPITSLSKAEYEQLNLPVLKYVLCANGGVLIKDGVEDKEWYQKSLELAKECQGEFEISKIIFQRCTDVEFVDNLFLKVKSEEPKEIVTNLLGTLYHSNVDILNLEKEIYVTPKALDKGKSFERFLSYLIEQEEYYIDSTYGIGINFLDLRMLEMVNYVLVSKALNSNNFTFLGSPNYSFERHEGAGDFFEWVLNKLT